MINSQFRFRELRGHPRCLIAQRFDPRAHHHLMRIKQTVHRDHDRLQQH
jgi:hypothetical protein